MNHTVPVEVSETAPDTRWLLLIHQLPAKPAYLRVKLWRRLQALGAVAVKNAVYALPASERAQEDFEWLLKEAAEGGGEGLICEARLIDGLSDDEVRAMFDRARDAEYDTVAKEARSFGESLAGATGPASRTDARAKLARLRAEAARIAAVDFFGAAGREAVDGLLAALDASLREADPAAPVGAGLAPMLRGERGALAGGRVWVTRAGVHVDRIASAWLIRRFIDRDARFKFVAAKDYVPGSGELRFDMVEAEFTHEDDRCTFEVLLARAGLPDPALAAIGEIVHDIDLKDAKFGRGEASGIAHLIEGISAAHRADLARIERGGAMFDDLYEYFRTRPGQAGIKAK